MSFENHVQFNVTENFLKEIMDHYDIYSLKIILKHYLYNNDFIKCLLYKYKHNYHLFNSEFKEYIDYEKTKLFSNEFLPLSILCDKYCDIYSDQAYDLKNVENMIKILIENGADINKENEDSETLLFDLCNKYCDLYSDQAYDLKNVENMTKILIENSANIIHKFYVF